VSSATSRQVVVSPALNKLLDVAQVLAAQKKFEEALAKLNEAEASSTKSPDEKYLINRARIQIASATNNKDLLVRSTEAVLSGGVASQEEKQQYSKVLAHSYFSQKDYSKAIAVLQLFFNAGGSDDSMRDMLSRSYYLNSQWADAAREVTKDIQKVEATGGKPSEMQLKILSSSANKMKDRQGYATAMEKLALYYPKKEYLAELIVNLISKPSFPDSLALDAYRLMHATGQVSTEKDYTAMAQLAMVSGYPAEAKKVLEEGFSKGLLGSGSNASKHKQQLETAKNAEATETRTLGERESQLAKNKLGAGLVDLGFAYADRGQYEKGIALMEEGISLGKLKRPDEAKLRLGVAYVMAGQKDKAQATFAKVEGKTNAAELAKYWNLHLKSGL
jgi:hypothetical protein